MSEHTKTDERLAAQKIARVFYKVIGREKTLEIAEAFICDYRLCPVDQRQESDQIAADELFDAVYHREEALAEVRALFPPIDPLERRIKRPA